MDPVLLQLFRELMTAYDPSIDTSDASPFYTRVMQPLLQRIGPDPLSGDAEELVAAYVDSEFDGAVDVSELSELRQLMIRPTAVVFDVLRRVLASSRATRALANYAQMTRAEFNERLSDLFITLQDGGTVALSVRVYFSTPQSRTFTPFTRFYTGSGLSFYPATTQAVTAAEMSLNIEGALYFVDVNVVAQARGSAYVVDARAIVGVENVSGVVRVANLRSAAPVEDDETMEAGYDRARDSITQRTLTTVRGIKVVLPEDLGAFSDIRVVGADDPLMRRDIVQGPVAISGIPGGVRGRTSPSVGNGQEVHVGGFTDVYVRRGLPTRETLDIAALTDVGFRVWSGTTGYTAAGPATHVWQDDTGNFVLNGVRAGDILRVGSVERTVTVVTAYALTFSGAALASGQFQRTYEVVRRTVGYLSVPLYDLVAEADGVAVLNESDVPVRPVPGDDALEPLIEGGTQVLATANRASENVHLPLVRIERIELLDPTTLEPTDLLVPQADLFGVRTPLGLSGGAVGVAAQGKVRCYFRDPVSAYAAPDTAFRIGSWTYRLPVAGGGRRGLASYTARIQLVMGDYKLCLLNGNYVSALQAGDRILGSVALKTYAVVSASFDGTHTVLTVREEAGDWFTATTLAEAAQACPGVRKEDMPYDGTFGLYYLEVDVDAAATGTGGNAAAEATLTHVSGIRADGWLLKSTRPVESYSTRDLPYLLFSDWPDDETWLADPGSDYAVRITYAAAAYIEEVQNYVEDDENEYISEDILVKHFLPAYVRGAFYATVPDTEKATQALRSAVLALKADSSLQVSDLVDELKPVGSTYTRLPVRLVVLQGKADRTWSLLDSADQVAVSAAYNYLPDDPFLSVSLA